MSSKYTQMVDPTMRSTYLSGPGSLKDEPLRPYGEKSLKIARTIAGTSTASTLQMTQLSGLTVLSEINTNIREKSYSPYMRSRLHENVSEILQQDENLGIKTNGDLELEQKNNLKSKSIPGLYPRLSIEGKNFPGARIPSPKNQKLSDEINNEPEVEQSSSNSFVTVISKNFDGLRNIKNTFSLEEDNVYDDDSETKCSRKFTNVEFDVPKITLLDDSEPLDLSPVKRRLVPYASPFFQTIEFSPFEPTDTGILLKILNHEFESLGDENDDEPMQEKENKRIPWYRQLLSLEKYYTQFINSFKPLSKEEYNSKYPWDKFYDPELYYDNDMDDEGVLNTELLPENSHNSISSEINDYMKPYSYISRRRG